MNCPTVQFERFPLLGKEGNMPARNSFTPSSTAPTVRKINAVGAVCDRAFSQTTTLGLRRFQSVKSE